MPINREEVVDAISNVLDELVEKYNQQNQSMVDLSAPAFTQKSGYSETEIVIDGGDRHGVYTIVITQE